MRKALLGTAASLAMTISAHAADLPLLQANPYVPPAFCWTGIYIGGHFAGAWAQRSWTDSRFGIDFDGGTNGSILGGVQIGGNYQIGNIVLGGEWDLGYATNSTNHNPGTFVPSLGTNVRVSSRSHWVSTLAARFGVAFDRMLVYAKAGGGWVGNSWLTITDLTTDNSIATSNNLAGGWLVGGGMEWAVGSFVNPWTIKLEYNYIGLGSWSYTVPITAKFLVGDTFTANRNVQMVKIGFNYLFNGPISSRYY